MAETRFTEAGNNFGHADKAANLNKTEARQAVTLGSMRYVLGISLALAAVAFVVLYYFYM